MRAGLRAFLTLEVSGIRAFETAFSAGTESSAYLALLQNVHAAFIEGRRAPAQPRTVIRESWRRVRRFGVSPSHVGGGSDQVASSDSLKHDRHHSAMMSLLPMFSQYLDPLIEDDHALMVLTDEHSRVLWRSGGRSMLHNADNLGFRPGDSWSEDEVGTNAIGTSLVTRTPVHVHAAEHFCYAQHRWSCAAAPVIDPRTGRPIGAIDISFLVADAHPSAVVLATSLARQAELELRDAHRRSLARLASAGSAVAPMRRSWAIVDRWGWVASAGSSSIPRRVVLPDGAADDRFLVEGLGVVQASALAGGWLLMSVTETHTEPSAEHTIHLTVGEHSCTVSLGGDGRGWMHTLVGRRAEIVRCLADRPHGVSAQQLAELVYGSAQSTVAVRAEIHRIRRMVGGLIETKPYRIPDGVRVTVQDTQQTL